MKKAGNTPFDSDFGFSSPGFIVDDLGNITARSITTDIIDAPENIVDYTVTDDGTNFYFSRISESNPAITLIRATMYRFQLNLTNFQFFLYKEDGNTLFDLGLNHSDGDRGTDAQGKSSGILSITVPSTYTAEDSIIYNNQSKNSAGTIILQYPTGIFGELTANAGIASTSATTGTLKVDGGAGIKGDVYIDGDLNLSGIGIPKISSLTNLELNANNKIILQIADTKLVEINSSGLETTINNSTINSSSLTNSTVDQKPISNNSIANKIYVDDTVTALAIALGI